MKMLEIINLKENLGFVEEYVTLRNAWKQNLLTDEVDLDKSYEWVKNSNTIILGVLENRQLTGVGMVYLDKENEIALFVKNQKKGLGTLIMRHLINEMKERNFSYLRGWTYNPNMRKLFEKYNFKYLGERERAFKGEYYKGGDYEKWL